MLGNTAATDPALPALSPPPSCVDAASGLPDKASPFCRARPVRVLPNGESGDGAACELAPEQCGSVAEVAAWLLGAMGETAAAQLEAQAWGPRSGPDGSPVWRVYAANGELVVSWPCVVAAADAAEDGRPAALYLVPEGRLFVWPSNAPGTTTAVPGCVEGREASAPPVVLENLHSSPRIFRVRNFLSSAESDAMIDEALSLTDDMYKLQRSGTGHVPRSSDKKTSTFAPTWTSENAFVSSSPLAARIKRRAFELLRIGDFDMLQGDGIQVLRYQPGQAYIQHTDYFPVKQAEDWNWDAARNGSNRFATVFLYLSDVEHGGQVAWPGPQPHNRKSANPHAPQSFRRLAVAGCFCASV